MKRKRLCTFAFVISIFIFLILFQHYGYAPFGDNSLASNDASVQYLDFYSYFKDVLAGKNSITYTFTKTLGGSAIAIFSYYLSSPFTLLLLLFPAESFHVYFNLVVALKLSLAAFTFCWFLTGRFREQLGEDPGYFQKFTLIILSLGYSFSQYSIGQSSNIMWLDGVYLLPLILLGVHTVVRNGHLWKLTIPVALSILFNWYTGGINCLFSGVWMLFELCLIYPEYAAGYQKPFRRCLRTFGRYILAMICGVLCSCCLFLPTVFAMRNSNRGSLDLTQLLDFTFNGNPASIISNYVVGTNSAYGSVAFFCGTFAFVGVIALFLSSWKKRYEKKVFACLGILTILLFYWNPFYAMFSLLKSVSSFWCRYSYVGIIVILFFAARFYLEMAEQQKPWFVPACSLVFAGALFTLKHISPVEDLRCTYITIGFLLLWTVLLAAFFYFRAHSHRLFSIGALLCASVILVGELACNGELLMQTCHVSNLAKYSDYITEERVLISDLKDLDSGDYRISQTATSLMYPGWVTAKYNEAMSYNFYSISGYTSSPDDNQRDFLERCGYRKCGENMNITNTSILGTDSLLGVKYVLSRLKIKGLEPVDSIEGKNKKTVYKNPYALPLAFKYPDATETISQPEEGNPFEYQNYLYSVLCGHNVTLYTPLEYALVQQGDSAADKPLVYSVSLPKGNYAFYGNIPWNTPMESATLHVNKHYNTRYSWWLAPSVFHISSSGKKNTASLSISSPNNYDVAYGCEQFYALNLDALRSVTEELSKQEAEKLTFTNGYVQAVCQGKSGENMYLSVPSDRGWKVTLNGSVIQPDLVGDCMYSIPLTEGENTVVLKYSCPGLDQGIVISLIGAIITVVIFLYERKKRGAK